MFSPAELIEALRRRQRLSIRPSPQADGLAPTWKHWLQATAAALPDAAIRASDVLAPLIARPPLQRQPAEELRGWRALRALWRQQWDPPIPDERGLRVLSRTLSILLHLVFLVLMAWLMHARFMLAPPADAQRGEHVIEVEFIGEGTPEQEGGGAPPQPEAAAVVDAPLPSEPALPPPDPDPQEIEPEPAPVAAVEMEPEPEPVAAVGSEPGPEPLPETPVAEQPLEVTETPLPDGPFQVPPIQALEVPAPQVREVEVTPRERSIELAETVELSAPQVRAPDVPVRAPAQPEIAVQEREIAMRPRPSPLPAPEVRVPDLPAPIPSARQQEARIRDIPMPPATGSGEAAETAAETGPASQSTADIGPPAEPEEGEQASGTGPAQAATDGAWTAPSRGDDPGASSREIQGGQAGASSLFNPDGSVRLPPGQGQVGGGLPPGTITEDYEKIDRMGTWLRRPPTDYEPTRFDRFWVPHENLLEEWVRRSIRTVLIPIPGTGKTLRCNVATLALAGGCDLVDPDLQDQPAGARPPPDIPFRPELHEDQDGLSDDVWE